MVIKKYPMRVCTIIWILVFGMVATALAQWEGSPAQVQLDSLIDLSKRLSEQRQFQQAFEVLAHADHIVARGPGDQSPAYALVCYNRGRIHFLMGDVAKAEGFFLEAYRLRQKTLDQHHPDYAQSLNSMAILYYTRGQYDAAEPYYEASVEIYRQSLGEQHIDYIKAAYNLGLFYNIKADHLKALALLSSLKENLELAKNDTSAFYGYICRNMGNALYAMGRYEEALPLFVRAREIIRQYDGETHPQYAHALNDLGKIHYVTGDYQKAEAYYLEAKALRKATVGELHPDYAQSLSNLANIRYSLGDYPQAEHDYLEAIDILAKTKGEAHIDYAEALTNLAVLYSVQQDFASALPLYETAADIRRQALGDDHPAYAITLTNMATAHRKLVDYTQAEKMFLQARDIFNQSYGPAHYYVALNSHLMGLLYEDMAEYAKAETMYEEAIAIIEKVFGPTHPDYPILLYNSAVLREKQGLHSMSDALLAEYFTLTNARLASSTAYLSARELAMHSGQHAWNMHELLRWLDARVAADATHTSMAQTTYDNILFHKGFLQLSAMRLHQTHRQDSSVAHLRTELGRLHHSLARAYALPLSDRENVQALEFQAEALEKELARALGDPFGEMTFMTWEAVEQNLQPGEAAIEFVHFRSPEDTVSHTHYAALLLQKGMDAPRYVPLCSADDLRGVFPNAHPADLPDLHTAYAYMGSPSDTVALYRLIWEKLEKQFVDAPHTVYLAPSGLLHRVHFAAIPLPGGQNVMDRYQLIRLHSTRTLADPSMADMRDEAAPRALVMGNITYHLEAVEAVDHAFEMDIAASTLGEMSYERTLTGSTWRPLAYTQQETTDIGQMLKRAGMQVELLRQVDASEENLKRAGDGTRASPRVLHLATHGFFFPDPELTPSFRRALGEAEPVFKSSDNPMIRSGILLAGANYAWQHGRPSGPGREDGILTAYEISQLDLANTELVVLSACETGLGDIRGNEGVYGLQRAFKIAGARYLMMSLWQVSDMQTMLFMTTFYRHWLEGGMTIPEAFRRTQQEMRDLLDDPALWAAFILLE
jgi:tetratricopeptide (TPR) repeat protein